MKVTKQQKILGGVLILGAIALGMDRFVFPQAADNAASADASSEYAVSRSGTPAAVAAMAPGGGTAVSISQRLRDAQQGSTDASTMRDAFAVPASWLAQPVAVAGERPADQFRRTRHLTGVLASGGHAYAMVDGKIVGLGQSVDGFRLTAVSHRSAIFESAANERVVLSLSETTATSGSGMAGAEP